MIRRTLKTVRGEVVLLLGFQKGEVEVRWHDVTVEANLSEGMSP